jgi:hypothetical protein
MIVLPLPRPLPHRLAAIPFNAPMKKSSLQP